MLVKTVRIATRGSDLALVQARYVASRVEKELGLKTELVVISTTGDQIQNISLSKIGGKGLFIKEIEEALLAGRADLAVHSAKDLPASIAPGLRLSAFPQREDPRDALIGREVGQTLLGLPQGARIGTGSTRRASQLLSRRPDLEIVPLRGNVPTRLKKLDSESLTAVILACAGLDRLGFSDVISERISPDVMLPAVCQGTLALETREGDDLDQEIARLDSEEHAVAAEAERAFLRRLGGDCTIPLAAYCESLGGGHIRVRARLASPDGSAVFRAERHGGIDEAGAIGTALAEEILKAGGDALLQELRALNQSDDSH